MQSGIYAQPVNDKCEMATPLPLDAFNGTFYCIEDSIDAVSYTHLRAHETVLDLVCRLLLEKKKTQHNEQTKQKKNTNRTQLPVSARHKQTQ